MKSLSPRPMLLLATLLFAMGASARPTVSELPGTLRIRLMETLSPRSATITAGPFGMAVFEDRQERAALVVGPGAILEVQRRGNQIQVVSQAGRVQAALLRLQPLGEGDMTIQVGSTRRTYAGELKTSLDKEGVLKLVNYVPLEDYVASVVASEYGLTDLEGSKAMAVIARTYGVKVINSTDDAYDHVDHTLSQVYRGSRAVTALARRAAEETRGQVLTHKGRLIEAVYSSSSGGYTANNEDVWQTDPHAYLRGRPDPWDAAAPHHQWESSISRKQLLSRLSDALGMDLNSIEIAARSQDGRVSQVKVVSKGGRSRTLTSDQFRSLVRKHVGEKYLKSTKFDLELKGDTYRFRGAGFGHGVGLSQYGAHAMALAGRSYRDILDFYYTDVRLEERGIGGSHPRTPGLLAATPVPTPASSDRLAGDALAGRFMPGRLSPAATPRAASASTQARTDRSVSAWSPPASSANTEEASSEETQGSTRGRAGW